MNLFRYQLIQDNNQHSVSFTLSRGHAIIVQYDRDHATDMFQIGRSSEGPIDFVVMDTVPGDHRRENASLAQSTISRFACRIIVERNPPYTARIYAAGFDAKKNIFLGVSCFLLWLHFFFFFCFFASEETKFNFFFNFNSISTLISDLTTCIDLLK